MSKTNTVAVDLARHPDVQYAVVWQGRLLPIRFASEMEAATHLSGLDECRVHPDDSVSERQIV